MSIATISNIMLVTPDNCTESNPAVSVFEIKSDQAPGGHMIIDNLNVSGVLHQIQQQSGPPPNGTY